MVEIQCPHCEGNVELEDNSFGVFDCPHCDGPFEYESSSSEGSDTTGPGLPTVSQNQLSLAVSISGVALGVLAIMVFFSALSFDTMCPEEERSTTEINGEEVISCTSEEFLWETQMAKLLFNSCCLMVPGSLVLTSLGYILRKRPLERPNTNSEVKTTPHANNFADSKVATGIQAAAMFFGIGISAVVAIIGAVMIGVIVFFLYVMLGYWF